MPILISTKCFAHMNDRQVVVKGAVWYANHYTCKQQYSELQDKNS